MVATLLRRREAAPATSGRTPWGRRAIAGLGALATLLGAFGVAAHFWSPGPVTLLGVSAFSPYLMAGALLGLVLFLLARFWRTSLAALVVLGVAAWTQVPLYLGTPAPADGRPTIVMTSNLRLGLADPQAVVDAVRRHGVEVLMVQELTDQEQARLIAAGLDRVLPYHVSAPSFGGLGTGLWSRYPLRDEQVRHDFNFNFVAARVTLPGVAVPVQAVAVHMCGPYPDATCWHEDIDRLPRVLPQYALAHGSTLVGGDFNATPDVTQFRALLHDGYADGADQAGAGMTRSYPADHARVPPLIAIDHVLTRNAVATSARTIRIAGSDHLALLTTVSVPRRAAAT